MTYIDPHKPDGDYSDRQQRRREAQQRKERIESGQATYDDQVFRSGGTYRGSKSQLARLAARRTGNGKS